MKKLIVFDLDGTLAESKSSLDPEMISLLHDLLNIVKVAIISGGGWPQFEKQILSNLPHDEVLKDLSLLPTCGTQFYQFDGSWVKLYSEDFNKDEKKKIMDALRNALNTVGFSLEKVWDTLNIEINEMIFIGDAIFPEGNDYPPKEAGVASIMLKNPEGSKRVIEAIIACLSSI